METTIIFKESKEALSLGRNGYVWTSGLDIRPSKMMVELSPITSRGNVASCSIQIPKEHIQDLINALEKLK